MTEDEDVVARRPRRVDDLLDLVDTARERLRRRGADRATGRQPHVGDDDVGAGRRHEPGFLGVEDVRGREEVEGAGGGNEIDLVVVAHPRLLEICPEHAVDEADGGKVLNPGKAHVFQLAEEPIAEEEWIGAVDAGEDGRVLHGRQHFAGHVADDFVGVAVGEKPGQRAAPGHPVAAGVVDHDQIDAAGLLALGRQAGAGTGADDGKAAADLVTEPGEDRRTGLVDRRHGDNPGSGGGGETIRAVGARAAAARCGPKYTRVDFSPVPSPSGVSMMSMPSLSGRLLAGLLCLAALVAPGRVVAEEEYQCRCHGGLGHDHSSWADAFGAAADDSGNGRRYAPDRAVDMLHIRIDVTPDFARHTVRGTTSLTFKPIAKPLEQLRLDAVDLTVHGVKADVPVADHTATRGAVIVRFAEPIPVDREVTLHIEHEAEPRRGLYFRTPDMGYPAGDTHVWTQGESHEARHWFPCHDYPNERSTTEVICHVPPEMTVLSNGRKVAEEVDAATGLKRVQWIQEKPHVSYLVCLVAGNLAKLEGRHRDVPLGFYTQPSTAAEAVNSFEDTASIMAFFEDDIGVPYPWGKYDQVTIQDFVAGGMENTSLTTLTDQTLHTKATETIRSSRGLDAHELAHQWFGDLVTCKDWSHLWLNEGFATYYAHLYDGHKFGRDELLYGLWNDAEGRILTQGDDTRPVVWKGYNDASEQFDYRAYPKGGWVLHMLRSHFGDDLYRKAVKTYLDRHSLSTVTTDDLRQVFEELSGKPLDRFFDQWLYHARHPDLRIGYQWNPEEKLAHVTVRQTQPASDKVLTFAFDTTVRFTFDDGTSVERPVRVTGISHDFHFPLDRQPKLVRFDPHYTLLAKVDFPVPEAMHLAQLDVADDSIGRIIAVKGLEQMRTRAAVERLGKALREDGFRGVREQAAHALQAIGSDEALAELRKSLGQPDARVRRRVVEGIAASYRPGVMEQLVTIVGTEKNPAIQAVALHGLAKYQDPAARDTILDALRSDSYRQEVAEAAMDALGQQQDVTLLQPLIRLVEAKPDVFPPRVLGTGLRTAGKLGRLRDDKAAVRDFLTPHLLDARPSVRHAAIGALGELGDPQSEALLQGLAKHGSSDRTGKVAEGALAALRGKQPLVPGEVTELRSQVRKLEESQHKLLEKVDDLDRRLKAKAEPAAPQPLPAG